MKKYKDFEKKFIGSSDISSLNFRFPNESFIINYGGDSSYFAYIVDDKDVEIPAHYKLVCKGKKWLWIYDDEDRRPEFRADKIEVYRAGEYGTIIKLIKE